MSFHGQHVQVLQQVGVLLSALLKILGQSLKQDALEQVALSVLLLLLIRGKGKVY